MEGHKYFFCYSYKLKLFLKEKNIRYEFTGNNPNNSKPYWGYLRNEMLGNCLKKWKEINQYTGEGRFDNFYSK